MLNVDLSPEEREALREALGSVLSDLRMEIADTDSFDFRERLRVQQRALQKLIAALGAPPGGTHT